LRKRSETIPGIGILGATTIATIVTDPKMFRSGRDFAAWVGLVPRQDSTGGKQKLGPISKQGDRYLRRILVVGSASSRWVEQQLGRPVIKAFNNIYARHLFELGGPAGAPGRIALPVAGDDDAAKTVVLKLVEELDGVDAGGLDESWRQQPGTPVYTKNFDADGVRRGLYEASKVRTPEWRGTSNSPGSFTAPA
jgi:hypothetical protein